MKFLLSLLELDGIGGDIHRQIHARRARGGIEERNLHRSGDGSGRGTAGAIFQSFFDWVAGKQVPRPDVAVTGPRPDVGSAALDFYFDRVTASLGRFAGRITENVVLILLLGNFLETS